MRDKEDMEFLADPASTMRNIAVLSAIYTRPAAKLKGLNALDEFTRLRLVCECLFFIKDDQLDITRQKESGKVQTPTKKVRTCAEYWANRLGLDASVAHELIEHIVFGVISPEEQRTFKAILPDGTHSTQSDNLKVGKSGMDYITLSEDLILALGRLDDTLMDPGVKKLTFAEYQLKMAIASGKVEGVNESLHSIELAISEQVKMMHGRIENVKLDFSGQDYKALDKQLEEERDVFNDLLAKMENHQKALKELEKADAAESLDAKGELDTGKRLIDNCIEGLTTLVQLTIDLQNEIEDGAVAGDELYLDNLYDFRSAVSQKLGTLSIAQVAAIGRAMLAPAQLWKSSAPLIPQGLFVSSDPQPIQTVEDGFVDMSIGPELEAEEACEDREIDTSAAEAAIKAYLGAHDGEASLNDLYEDETVSRHLGLDAQAVRKVFLGDSFFNGDADIEPATIQSPIALYGVGEATNMSIRLKENSK